MRETLSYINRLVSYLFGLLIRPFESMSPLWTLTIYALLIGILMLLIFRYTSDQQKIRDTKSKIRAYIFELSLFKNEVGIVLSAQKNIFIHNLKYIKYALQPMLFMVIPLMIILIQLESWYGHRPLRPDETAVVSLKLREGGNAIPDATLTTGEGVDVETPPLRIPEEREVDWRIRAQKPGMHELKFNVSGEDIIQKVMVSADDIAQTSPLVSASDVKSLLLNPALKPLPEGSLVERISIDYPSNSIEIYKWHVHWLVVVFVLSIVFGFALKGLFRVEI